MTENTKDIIDAIDEAILDPEPPPATVVPNDLADSITIIEVKPRKTPARKPAPRKPVAKKPAPGKEVDKAPAPIEGELPLEKSKAEALDKKITTAITEIGTAVAGVDDRISKLTDMVNEAKAGQIHVALGFASWTAYFTERVQTPVVSITERKNVIALLHDAGMSQRDIATQVKVSVGTVNATVQELNASRPASAEKPAAKTVDKRGAVRDRAKAASAGKKAAAQKKSSTGRVTGKPPSRQTITIGDMLVLVNGANASKFNEGQIRTLRAIGTQIERILKEWDTNAANNKNAKA
jgi:hypothetical protein